MENHDSMEESLPSDSNSSMFSFSAADLSDQLSKCEEVMNSEDMQGAPLSGTSASAPSSSGIFEVDKTVIPCIPVEEQELELQNLGVCAYDQTKFETEVMGQVDKAIKREEEERRKIEVEKELKSVTEDIRSAKQRLGQLEKALSFAPKDEKLMTPIAKREVISIKKEQENKMKQLKKLEAKQKMLNSCFSGDISKLGDNIMDNHEDDSDIDEQTRYHLEQVFAPKETEEERLIRTGQMTPFGTVHSHQAKPKPKKIIISENHLTDFDKFLLNEAEEQQKKKRPVKISPKKSYKLPDLSKPSTSRDSSFNFDNNQPCSSQSPGHIEETLIPTAAKPIKPKIKKVKLGSKYAEGILKKTHKARIVKNFASDPEMSDIDDVDDDDDASLSDADYKPEFFSGESDMDSEIDGSSGNVRKKKRKIEKNESNNLKKSPSKKGSRVIDDGCQDSYIKRMKQYRKAELLKKHQKIMESEDGIVDSDEECAELNDFKVPCRVWDKLYNYQQTGVQWLWELHQQNCGGIVGDEMGLGKTIQILVFLVGLEISNQRTDGDLFRGRGPVVLVCPATVMHQWVRESHTWWPPFRVAVLHESGSYVGKKSDLVRIINRCRGILITSYIGLVKHQEALLQYDWHYVILDEGHKIRNPDAQATLVAKQFRTPHRLILSGSPVQNNLKELWSLFDFVFPGKLGTLPVFMQQFSVPIIQGGYANATQVQVQTAYKCATVLRDTIKPYLLRRMKADVNMSIHLPSKNEQVLFCKLSEEQVQLYKAYINSPEVQSILNARFQVFVGLINLRKICNHPDLYTGGPKIFKDTDVDALSEEERYGYYKHSGKMIVVESLLRLWHKQGHKVLLFTQSRQMMAILEIFVKSRGYTYMRMDGTTSISSRQPAISKFNSDPSIFVFLLTTRVGGLGVNLTGANRIIIFDPDWNPSTDAQAKERSWRIGQEKQVTIYRLLTAGTIEEKIYHRQIFKQFVTNRVLKDPRQRRFFKSNDLFELFTFSEIGKEGTETSAIFAGTGSEIKPVKNPRRNRSSVRNGKKVISSPKPLNIQVSFSATKIEKMKELAKRLSSQLTQNKTSNEQNTPAEQSQRTTEKRDINSVTSSEVFSCNPKQTDSRIKEMTVSPGKNEASDTVSKDLRTTPKEKMRKKRHNKKKWKSAVIEGEEIKYLVKTDVYRATVEEDQKSNAENDDYVLSKLFKKSGVHTALKHDVIVESSAPDYMLVEGEANKVAREAIKALRQSRRQCARAVEGIPTWTGSNGHIKQQFGAKKRLPPPAALASNENIIEERTNPGPSGILCKRVNSQSKINKNSPERKDSSSGVLSSADLLSAIKRRKEMVGHKSDSDEDGETITSIQEPLQPQTEFDELLVDMRNFIAFSAAADGQATTEELLQNFKGRLPKEHTAVFKSLLSKICDFSRTTAGDGIWYLKEEFR